MPAFVNQKATRSPTEFILVIANIMPKLRRRELLARCGRFIARQVPSVPRVTIVILLDLKRENMSDHVPRDVNVRFVVIPRARVGSAVV